MTHLQSPTVPPALLAHESALCKSVSGNGVACTFSESRLRLLHQSLSGRLRRHGMRGYREYCQYIICHPEGEREWQVMPKLLLNHETSFFRHLPSFEILTGYALPALMSDTQRGNTLTMWSVRRTCQMANEDHRLRH